MQNYGVGVGELKLKLRTAMSKFTNDEWGSRNGFRRCYKHMRHVCGGRDLSDTFASSTAAPCGLSRFLCFFVCIKHKQPVSK